MNYRTMKATGVKVSELCLGTMMFGGKTSKEESLQILDYAINNGVNYIDTADMYEAGESERIVGEALKGRRQDIFLATKVRYRTGDGINDSGLSRFRIMKQVEQSLRNLQTEHIDLYYLHAMDPDVDFEEMLDTMTTLVHSGKVRYVGVSNFPAWQVAEMQWLADKHNYIRPVVTQNLYNLVARDPEIELVPCMKRYKIGMTNYNPIAGGLFSGKYDFDKVPDQGRLGERENYRDRYWKQDILEVVKQLDKLAGEAGLTLLELALKWCSSHDYIDAVISGVSRLDQIKTNILAVNHDPLTAEVLEACNNISDQLYKDRIHYFKS